MITATALAAAASVMAQSDTSNEREPRVALVIGNGAYQSMPLSNPLNDARDIARTLSGLGFQVTLRENITQQQMRLTIRDFGNELKKGGVGLFYFAGHGMQVKGRNFLIPVGADIQSEDEIDDQSVDVSLVLEKMETAQNRLNIVILDACRNNPLARSARSGARGLAAIDAAKGTLIAYATAPGSFAADGAGRNSPYTKHLLASLKHSESDIERVFKRVRAEVVKETGGKQTPWESSSLTGDFYFNPAATAKPQQPGQVLASQAPSQLAIEIAYWETIQQSSNPADFQAYLSKYPKGQFAELARNRLQKAATDRPGPLAAVAPPGAIAKPPAPALVDKILATIPQAARSASDASPRASIPIAALIRHERSYRADDNGITSLAVSPDGNWVATGTHSKITVWNIGANTNRTLEGLSFWTYALAFSRDGRVLASGANSQIILWDVATWTPRTKIDTRKSRAHSDAIKSLAFSPDGKLLASGGWRDQTVHLWDGDTGALLRGLAGQPGGVASVAFSPDGSILASLGEGGAVLVWDAASGNRIKSFDASSPSEGERSLAFSPDGAILAAAGTLWEVASWKRKGNLETSRSNAFSPDGRFLATWSGNSLSFWDVAAQKRLKSFRFSDSSYSVGYSPDGKRLYAGVAKSFVFFDLEVFTALSAGDPGSSIRNLELERDRKIGALSTRGEFETTKEFEQRIRSFKADEARLQQQYERRIAELRAVADRSVRERKAKTYPYSIEVNIGRYDADSEVFEVEMLGEKFLVPVARDQAKEIAARKIKERIVLEGNLRYLDHEKVELVSGTLRYKGPGG